MSRQLTNKTSSTGTEKSDIFSLLFINYLLLLSVHEINDRQISDIKRHLFFCFVLVYEQNVFFMFTVHPR